MHRGKVYLVGAGPGDPELLTLKARKALDIADVIIYDRLVSEEVLALANPHAELVYAGKESGEQDGEQARIYGLLAHHAGRGSKVVRLKGGDPMVFGRGAEEMQFLAARGLEVEVVPGISSAIAAPSLAGIPLTCRAFRRVDTLVVLMGVQNRDFIAISLIDAGRPASQPVAFVEQVSRAEERVVESTLGEVARRVRAFSASRHSTWRSGREFRGRFAARK